MKTALILGGAAIAIYVVWKFGTASAPPRVASSDPLVPDSNSPYPAALPPPPTLTPDQSAFLLTGSLGKLLDDGVISSTTAVATKLTVTAAKQFQQAGYIIVGGNAYPAGPNPRQTRGASTNGLSSTAQATAARAAMSGSGSAVVSGGLTAPAYNINGAHR